MLVVVAHPNNQEGAVSILAELTLQGLQAKVRYSRWLPHPGDIFVMDEGQLIGFEDES